MKTLAWVGTAAMVLLTAAPALAETGRTYWMCTKLGCVQIDAPLLEPARALPVTTPMAVQPVSAHRTVGTEKKPVSVETLIDLSLVTGVFQ